MKIIFIIIFLNTLLALPRFAIQNGTNCISCHINPTGGALRNDYGTNIVSIDELPLTFWSDQANGYGLWSLFGNRCRRFRVAFFRPASVFLPLNPYSASASF